MSTENIRQKKQQDKVMTDRERPAEFSFISKDPDLEIEATAESPVMYQALGTEIRTQHPFNVYHDIMTEPVAIARTLEVTTDSTKKVAAEFIKRDIRHIVGIGMGTSQFVMQASGPAFWEWACITSEDRDSVEAFSYDKPYDFKHTALIAYSGSGRTFDTIAATRKMKEKGMYCVAITSIAGSPLTEITDDTIACAGGFDTGGSDTFHYATRVAASLQLALEIGKLKKNSDVDIKGLMKQLRQVPVLLSERLDDIDKRCRSIARHTKNMRSAIIVGSGPNFGSAEEMELKFEEMAHIPCKSMVPTRHLHGALGLTDEKITTIIFAPQTPCVKWIDQIVKTTLFLKTPSVGFVPDDDKEVAPYMDWVIRVPFKNEHIFALYVVPAIQLYPYYCAVEQGNINPDCQRSDIPKHARIWDLVLKRGGH